MRQVLRATVLVACLVAGVVASPAAVRATKVPPPPKLPADFTGKGRYIVRDLDVDVPFTWEGTGGDSQMIAGGDQYPIYFTNIISGGYLYTLTYKWPGIARRPCSRVGPFTLADFNAFLATSRYVGAETLDDTKPRRRVNHFRAGVVWEPPAEVLPPDLITPVGGTPATGEGQPKLRLPLMSADLYVDRRDPTTFWQVLHFGLQNLYDPELDEWMVLDSFAHRPGTVTLPAECAAATTSTTG